MASRAGTCDRRWCPGRHTIAARAGVGEHERGSARLRSVQAACMGQKARAVNVIIANRRTDPRRPASADLARTAAPCTEDLPTSSRPEPRTPLATAGRSGPRTHLATAERELAVPGAKDAPTARARCLPGPRPSACMGSAATRAPSCQTEGRPDRGRGSRLGSLTERSPPRGGRVWHGLAGAKAHPASLGRDPITHKHTPASKGRKFSAIAAHHLGTNGHLREEAEFGTA